MQTRDFYVCVDHRHLFAMHNNALIKMMDGIQSNRIFNVTNLVAVSCTLQFIGLKYLRTLILDVSFLLLSITLER